MNPNFFSMVQQHLASGGKPMQQPQQPQPGMTGMGGAPGLNPGSLPMQAQQNANPFAMGRPSLDPAGGYSGGLPPQASPYAMGTPGGQSADLSRAPGGLLNDPSAPAPGTYDMRTPTPAAAPSFGDKMMAGFQKMGAAPGQGGSNVPPPPQLMAAPQVGGGGRGFDISPYLRQGVRPMPGRR
jgi:hypothetical protein